MVVVSIFDAASGEFGSPSAFANRALAERSFASACAHADPLVVPDLSLYFLGDFDGVTGEIKPVAPVVWKRGKVE